MMKLSSSHIGLSFLCLFAWILSACAEEESPGPVPAIRFFTPNSGIIGSSVTIYGDHFIPPVDSQAGVGPHINTSIVKFNGIVAEAEHVYQDSISKQRIHTTVPEGQSSGRITITANGITGTSSTDFMVTVPTYLPNVSVSTLSNYGGIDLDIDTDGNLYVASNWDYEIFKLSPNGTKTTLLSTVNDENRGAPFGIAVDANGIVYANVGNTVRKILPDGTVSILAGSPDNDFGYIDGKGTEARFYIPWGITVDADGIVYVADWFNHRIRKIQPDGTVSTLAGNTMGSMDGPGSMAQFSGPIGIKADSNGNIFVTESAGRIRKISPDGMVTTLAGSIKGYLDGPAASAQFTSPRSITIDKSDNLYITDVYKVRRMSPDGMVATVAGSTFGMEDGPGESARFCTTAGITIDTSGAIYVTQGNGCYKIRRIVID